ncbi:MAG: HAD hydrolase-like protein [Thermaceae bacterium]|nr:HAD hydrolase-like protein [Thermaceae bacterium]
MYKVGLGAGQQGTIVVVIKRHSLPIEQTLVVGDRDLDVFAGQGAGLQTCLFRGSFAGITPDLMVTYFGELLDIIKLARA